MSPSQPAPADVKGAAAEDESGTPLGPVDAVFLDDATGQLGWVVVGHGAVVPAAGARLEGGRLRLPVSADTVRTAPPLGGRAHLDPEHLQELRTHYRLDDARSDTRSEPGAMTLTEERLAVSTVREAFARAVLRVETVTEEVMVPVTVTRQRARIEHLPPAGAARDALDDGDGPGTGDAPDTRDAAAGGAVDGGGQASPWVTLYGEEPVVGLRQVPLERVRLVTAWTAADQQVVAELRHEELALDGDVADTAAPSR